MAQQPQYGEKPQMGSPQPSYGEGQPQPNGYYGDKNGAPTQQPMQQPAQAYEHASKLPSKFQFGLFDCFKPLDLCCWGCWCPCVLFGRTYARERGEKDPSGCNGMCVAWYCAAHCYAAGIVQCMQRGNMNDRYGMENNSLTNCLEACFCSCCALVQEEKESLIRQTGIDPTTKQPYVAPTGMSYP